MREPRAAAAGSDPRPRDPRDRRALSGASMFADRTAPGADVQSLWRSARSARCESVRDPRGGSCTAGPGGGRLSGPFLDLLASCPEFPSLCWSVTGPARPGTESSRPGCGTVRGRGSLGPVRVLLIWPLRANWQRSTRAAAAPRFESSWCCAGTVCAARSLLWSSLPSYLVPSCPFRALEHCLNLTASRASLPPVTLWEGHKHITNTWAGTEVPRV